MTEAEYKQIDNKLMDVRIQVQLKASSEIIDQMLYGIQLEISKAMGNF